MKWTLHTIMVLVQLEDGRFVEMEFKPAELIRIDNGEVFDVITMKEFVDRIGERVVEA